MLFTHKYCPWHLEGKPLHNRDEAHWLETVIVKPVVKFSMPVTTKVTKSDNYELWHRRMGHPSKNVLRNLLPNTSGHDEKGIFNVPDKDPL